MLSENRLWQSPGRSDMVKRCLGKVQNWTVKAGRNVVFFCIGFICLYLFLCSIFSTCVIWYDTERTYYIKDFPVMMVLGLMGLTGLMVYLRRSISRLLVRYNVILMIMTVVWAVLLVIFIVNTDLDMIHDQARVYEGVREFISGNYEKWEMGGYFQVYPFQNGLMLLYAPVMLLFGENTYWAVQGINFILYFLLAAGLYKLAKLYFDKTVAFFTYVGVLYFFPMWCYVKYFYGTLPGLSLVVLSMYFTAVFMEYGKWRYWGLSAICLFIAVMHKSNFLIFAIAMGIVLIMEGIRCKKAGYIPAAVIMLISAILGMQVPSWIVHQITGCITNQGVPMIHWVSMGLSESYVAPGWYGGNTSQLFAENGYSVEAIKEISLESIRNSLALFAREKEYALRFFNRKLASIWNNPTFEGFAVVVKGNLNGTLAYWMKDILYSGGIVNTVLTLILDVVQSVYLFGMLLYQIYCRKEHQLQKAMPLVAFIGGFLFHILWEGKSQYTIIFFVPLMPYAYAGFKQCVQKISMWINEKANQQELSLRGTDKACHQPGQRVELWTLGGLLALILLIAVWDNTFFASTIKLQGDEADYIWLCTEEDYWKNDNFTKEGARE